MKPKANLLIVQKIQFGYLVDSYKWCQYLKDSYNITLICFDEGHKQVPLDGVQVRYVSGNSSLYVIRGLKFLLIVFFYLLKRGIVIIEYFEHCDLLKRLLPFRKMILDVRTVTVSGEKEEREAKDREIEQACKLYDMVSVISEGVRFHLKLGSDAYLLPLGADIISSSDKVIDDLRLLYVGTFAGRDIDKTIRAVSCFHRNHPTITIHYYIIGDGPHNELQEYRDLVKTLGIDDIVILYGRIPNNELKPYFDKANIGVSFVPMTDYYDIQPPTKTFEYTLSGLYTIATKTSENVAVITPGCGYLIEDTEVDFVKALEYILKNRTQIDSAVVRRAMLDYQWNTILSSHLSRIIDDYNSNN